MKNASSKKLEGVAAHHDENFGRIWNLILARNLLQRSLLYFFIQEVDWCSVEEWDFKEKHFFWIVKHLKQQQQQQQQQQQNEDLLWQVG